MPALTIEQLAAMLADAHREGWEQGYALCSHDPEQTFLEYQAAIEEMCTDKAKH